VCLDLIYNFTSATYWHSQRNTHTRSMIVHSFNMHNKIYRKYCASWWPEGVDNWQVGGRNSVNTIGENSLVFGSSQWEILSRSTHLPSELTARFQWPETKIKQSTLQRLDCHIIKWHYILTMDSNRWISLFKISYGKVFVPIQELSWQKCDEMREASRQSCSIVASDALEYIFVPWMQ